MTNLYISFMNAIKVKGGVIKMRYYNAIYFEEVKRMASFLEEEHFHRLNGMPAGDLYRIEGLGND